MSAEIISVSTSKVYCLRGELGAGKTTLTNHMLKTIGASELGTSPTFSIVNQYHNKDGNLLAYHLDCYRLESDIEALDIGMEDYLNADCYVFIEWPERIESLLPLQRTEISINTISLKTREITLVNLP